jgi:hypothetical protein
MILGFYTNNWHENMQPVHYITSYYGEKYGFYFAWIVHYTAMLVLPSIIGLIFFIIQVFNLNSAYNLNSKLPKAM